MGDNADGGHSRMVSRRTVLRLMRPHMVALAAMGVAATEAVAGFFDQMMLSDADRLLLRPKAEGLLVTAVWTEAVRVWLPVARGAGIRVHDPYTWVELIIGEQLHLRMHRDRPWMSASQRSQYWQTQLPVPDLDLRWGYGPPTNVEMIAHPPRRPCGAPVVQIHVKFHNRDEIAPITVPADAIRRQVERWRAKGVPWLQTGQRFARVGALEAMLRTVAAGQQPRPEEQPSADVRELPPGPDTRPTFRPYPRSGEQAEGTDQR